METIKLAIAGMSCRGCVMAVGGALKRVPGVASTQVDLDTGSAEVVYDSAQTGPEQLIAAVKQVGYGAARTEAA
jgi:copper chaperone CopZ